MEQRKQKQARNQHNFSVKEIKIRPKIATHDYELKKRNAIHFLKDGDKVKVTIRFRGREMAYPEIGMSLIQRFAADLKDQCTVESQPKQEGRNINMVLAPFSKQKQQEKKALAEKNSPKLTATKGNKSQFKKVKDAKIKNK